MRSGDARKCGDDWEVVKLRGRGARLADERSERRTSGDGVASGSATTYFIS